MEKIWKEILVDGHPCFPRREISNYGEIRRMLCDNSSETYIYKSLMSHGHPVYCITYKNHGKSIRKVGSLAKLVAIYFVGNPDNYEYVKNTDGNVLNCRADNLMWVKYKTTTFRRTMKSTFGQIEIDGVIYDNINHAIRELNNIQYVKGGDLPKREILPLCTKVTARSMRNMVQKNYPALIIEDKPVNYKMLYTPQTRSSIPVDILEWKEIMVNGCQCYHRREISNKGDLRRINDCDIEEEFYYHPRWSDGHPCYSVQYIHNGTKMRKSGLLSILVATCFIDNPNQYKHVRHIDGDIKNCEASNLEWVKYKISSSSRIAVSAYGRIMIEGFSTIYGNINEAVRELTKLGVPVKMSHIRSRVKRGKDTIKINDIETRYKMIDVPDHPANNW